MAKKTVKEVAIEADSKLAALNAVLAKIEKDYGQGTVMKLGETPKLDLEVIPSGSLALDHALGVGGYPKGRIIEIYGPESSGKTTLAIHAVAEAQKMGGIAAYIDAEHAFDREYAKCLGVDVDKLFFSQPDSGEDALDIAEKLISSNAIDILVVDSVAALTPRAEIEGDMGQATIGLQARLMSKGLRKLTSIISRTNTLCIFINQLRDKIGVMFGNPETTAGGNALKFYASVRIDVRRVTTNKNGDEAVSNKTRAKIVKNKVAPPFRKAEFNIEFGKGISKDTEVCDLAIEFDIIHKAGSWLSYQGEKLCQGRDKCLAILADNPELAAEIEAQVRAQLEGKEYIPEEELSEELIDAVDDIKESESINDEASEGEGTF